MVRKRAFDPSRFIAVSLFVGAIASATIGFGVAQAGPTPNPPDTMPLDQVKPGMKGYGLTVFSGTEPTKFDVEVISTLSNFRPNQSLILIKTPNHPRLEVARTVAGMSGSPIYLNGKMIGAYAYGWLFGAEAIAGVTPIASMIEEQERPIPKSIAFGHGSPMGGGSGMLGHHSLRTGSSVYASLTGALSPSSIRKFNGAPLDYQLGAHASQLAKGASSEASASMPQLRPASTPILFGGMSDSAMAAASDMLAPMGLVPVQAGGGGGAKPDPTVTHKFVDGGAIGVQLVSGDVSAMGLGTVTRVDGNKVLAFGHPMMNGGVSALPTAVAKVHWILASEQRSFKIGEPVAPLGALVNDRQAAIVVDTNVTAPTFPVRLVINGVKGAPKTNWNSEAAHDRFMAPMLTALAIGSALETTTAERREMTWRAESRIETAKYGTLNFVDFGAGNGNPIGQDDFARSRLVRAMGALLNNPWEAVEISAVDVKVDVTFDQEVSLLRGAKLLTPEIDAGQPARIRLEFVEHRGQTVFKTIEVPIPKQMAGESVDIDLKPGYEVERELPTPESAADLVNILPKQFFPAESIVATVKLKGEVGATFRGNVASRLPPGALDMLQTSTNSAAPEMFKSETHAVVPMGRFIVGGDSVKVEVRKVLK